MNRDALRLALRIIVCACLFTTPAQAASTCGGILNPMLIGISLLAFSNYNPNTDDAVSTTINVSCTVQLGNVMPSFTLGLSGSNGGSNFSRKMAFLTSSLNYNIYTNSSHTIIWGDGTGSTQTQNYSASSQLSQQDFTAWGLIPKGQYITPGAYVDSINILVTY